MPTRPAERARSESAAALIDTVERFWPSEPARIVSVRGTRSGFAFVPNAARPRLLLPVAGGRAASEVMRKYSSALTLRETAQRASMSLLFRICGVQMLRDRLIYVEQEDSLQAHLSSVLGTDVQFSVSVGTARANRKPILQIFDRRGTCLAYAKIGDGTVSSADVTRESESLDEISGRLPGVFDAPRKLHFGTWSGMPVLLISPLRVSVLQRPLRFVRVPVSEMSMLSQAFCEDSVPLVEAPFWERLAAPIAGLSLSDRRDRLTALRAGLASAAEGRSFRLGAWHGDWTPWNMAWTRGRLQLWDWERFEDGVLEGFDHSHFVVNTVTRRLGFEVPAIRSALAAEEESMTTYLEAGTTRLVQTSYLLALATRYARSAEGPTGALIAGRADVVLDAAEQTLTAPAASRR
jgi:hypothetical protein